MVLNWKGFWLKNLLFWVGSKENTRTHNAHTIHFSVLLHQSDSYSYITLQNTRCVISPRNRMMFNECTLITIYHNSTFQYTNHFPSKNDRLLLISSHYLYPILDQVSTHYFRNLFFFFFLSFFFLFVQMRFAVLLTLLALSTGICTVLFIWWIVVAITCTGSTFPALVVKHFTSYPTEETVKMYQGTSATGTPLVN